MKRKLIYSILLYLIWLLNPDLSGQDMQFSQFYTAKFNIAPSFAGTAEEGRLTILTRDQFPLIKNTFLTYGFAVDYYMSSLNGGLGFYAMQDNSNGGGFLITNAGFQYSYNIELTKPWHFRPGLQITCVNRNLNLNKITFSSQLTFDGINRDVPLNIESANTTNMEAAASLLFFNDRSWIGMSADHIPFTRNTFSGEKGIFPVKYTSFGGLFLKMFQGRLLYDRTYIYFSYLFRYMDKNKQLDLGCYLSRKGCEIGLWYRGLPLIKNNYEKFNNSALIFKGGVELGKYFIGYSYDLSLIEIGIQGGGAHELSLVYLFDLTDDLKKKKHKMVPGPRL